MNAPVNLPVSRLVNVGVVITPVAQQGQSLNTGLVLGTSTIIDTVQRIRNYATLAAVAADFGTSAEEYLAATLWFGQSPQPTSMSIGRWCKTAAAGRLICAALSAANQQLSAWTSIATGSFKIGVDGGAVTNVPNMNFTGAASLAAIAAIMQAAIQGLGGSFAAVTVIYNPVYTRFEITSGTTGSTSAIAFLQAGTTGTDISGQVGGLSTSSGAYTAPGVAAESAIAAVTLFDVQFGGQWYNLIVPDAVDADTLAIAPYIDGGSNLHFQWVTSSEANILLANQPTNNIAAQLQLIQSQHTAVQYSSQNPYAVWSMAARIATVNWAGSNTAISLMYKTEPGVTPDVLNETQITNLESYNCNVYTTYAFGTGTSIIETGICPSGQFIDTIIGVDALRSQIQTNIFNLLLGTATKIPQTDAGVATLETGADAACSQFVVNGLLAPGTWNANGFGQLVSGQYLDKGYYIYAQPIAQQLQSQRAQRIAPPMQIAAKLAGAIDTVSVTVYVNS